MSTTRLPPHSPEAEQFIIGCCFLDPTNLVAEATRRNTGPMFFDRRHAEILTALEAMSGAGASIDPITVQMRTPTIPVPYFMECIERVTSPASFDTYHQIVADKFYLRQVVSIAPALSTPFTPTLMRSSLSPIKLSPIFWRSAAE